MLITAMLFQIMIGGGGPLKPPRDAGIRVTSNQSLMDLQSCTIRQMARDNNTVVLVPLPNGVAIDMTRPNGRGKAQAARYSLHIRDLGNQRELSVFYRHPFSRGSAHQHTKIIARRCFASEYGVTAAKPERERRKLFGIF